MAHNISGIITSFKYTGDLPNVVLVGNYHLIAIKKRIGISYKDEVIEPYDNLTKESRKLLKELSFEGKCCYVETDYFGGPGVQMGETWEDGERIKGPLLSVDGVEIPEIAKHATVVEDAINENLKLIGIYRHDDLDEFDSARLGWYRSNSDITEEFQSKSK